MEVACGQCLGCRIDRSRRWAMRCVHEASLYDSTNGNSFVTLTYRDRIACDQEQLNRGFHIPDDWSLSVPWWDEQGRQRSSHFQAFMKRLRKVVPQKVKFYQCGEYGKICKHGVDLEESSCAFCNLGRPHHHALLFNLSFPDLEAYSVQNGTTRYTSRILEGLWPYGFVDVGQVTMESAGYVARYCMKKITGDLAEEHYRSIDMDGEVHELAPEYSSMSNGIGKAWLAKYRDDVYPSDEVPVPGTGVLRGVPRYYDEILRCENEDLYEEVKAKREQGRMDSADEYTPERLMDRYKVKKAQLAHLRKTL